MIRYFTFITLPTHLLLIGLIFLLHIPVFNPHYFLPAESLVYLVAQRLAHQGGSIYTDVWIGHPPLIVWLYQFFYTLFGEYTLTVVRIFRCLYIYGCVVYISGFINSLRVQERYNWVIPISMGGLLSTPWYALESSFTLFCLLPISFSFVSLLKLESGPRKLSNLRTMFWMGMWIAFYILLSYKTFPLLLGVVLGYLALRPYRTDEFISLCGGILILFTGVCLILFFSEAMTSFWDQGILFPWDRLVSGDLERFYTAQYSWTSLFVNWGPWIFLSLIGFIHYRIRFYTYVAKIRLVERLLSFWLFFGLAGILLKGSAIEIHDFILIAPPMSFYGAKAFERIKKRLWRWSACCIAILLPVFVFSLYWFPQGINSPISSLNSFSRKLTSPSPIAIPPQREATYEFLSVLPHTEQIWILAGWYDDYLRLGIESPNKYVDFAMLRKKLSCWNPDGDLISQKESERDFFLHLSEGLPPWIADPNDLFPTLQSCYPSLFSSYTLVNDKKVLIYQRNP